MITTPVKQWRRQEETSALIGKKGKIVSWTIIRVPGQHFMNQAPYPVVIVELMDGMRLTGQLVDSQKNDWTEGREVIAVLRRGVVVNDIDIIGYTIKFRPL